MTTLIQSIEKLRNNNIINDSLADTLLKRVEKQQKKAAAAEKEKNGKAAPKDSKLKKDDKGQEPKTQIVKKNKSEFHSVHCRRVRPISGN